MKIDSTNHSGQKSYKASKKSFPLELLEKVFMGSPNTVPAYKNAYFWGGIGVCLIVVFSVIVVMNGASITGQLVNGMFDSNSNLAGSAVSSGNLDSDSGIESSDSSNSNSENNDGVSESDSTDSSSSRGVKSNDLHEISLSFSQIPNLETVISVPEIVIDLSSINGKILLDGSELSVDSSSIELKLTDFSGSLNLESSKLSLDGGARGVSVNGVALNNNGDISVFISEIDYSSLLLSDMGLDSLYLPAGSGELEVYDRLTYKLKDEHLDLTSFFGEVEIVPQSSEALRMDGEVKSLELSGSLLELDVS
ncbi:hypothetical protein HOC01_02475 [archaeon]|nr:hypothetical protein [archaeon]MBT6697816.1 hypothetical protein [archaeon]